MILRDMESFDEFLVKNTYGLSPVLRARSLGTGNVVCCSSWHSTI